MKFVRKVIRSRHLVTEVTSDTGGPIRTPGATDSGLYVDGPGPAIERGTDGRLNMDAAQVRAWFDAQEAEILALTAARDELATPEFGETPDPGTYTETRQV